MKKTTIIAEAGVNHNGSIEMAKKLIEVAADAKADYVKFQTFKADALLIKNAQKASYQKKMTDVNESQYEMLNKLELKKSDHIELIDHCKKNNIKFLSTPFDVNSIDLLMSLDIPLFKIPSGEITNFPYLEYIGKKSKPIIMSSGMASLSEVGQALEVLINSGSQIEDITVLHCNTEYPTPMEDVNLSAMITIKKEYGVKVGYSDHTLGIEIPVAAVAMGASIIEKHFTLDRSFSGPDHSASLIPGELTAMVNAIRNIEIALGNGKKVPSSSEKKNIKIARKSIVAKSIIKVGEKFTKDNITVKRPATGLSPMKWNEIIGKISTYNYDVDDSIK